MSKAARKESRRKQPPGARTAPEARPAKGLSPDKQLDIYYYLKLNRMVEERLSALYRQGKVQGGLYGSKGQEAISVGSAYALAPQDVLAPMIRNLGAMLVRGVKPVEFFLQYMQKEGSPCKGRDTSLHFGGIDRGFVPPISPLGTLVPVLTGVALAGRMLGRKLVAMTYIGDGATSTGDFHEGMGIASVMRLPLVVIIENNRWAYSTPVAAQSLLTDLAEKARAYGIPQGVVDGNDVLAVHEATESALDLARQGKGPVLLEAKTMRMRGHSEHDDAWYVPEEERRFWEKRDPIALYEKRLVDQEVATPEELAAIVERCTSEIDRDLAVAEAAPSPRPESCIEDIYAPLADPGSEEAAPKTPASARRS
ncbi:MAG TPA: thiamine pyrophosphate-dependent dehydrogenase E1 component subunit alpha [Candidatus Polarisedimenticolia bacterium]|nr:thiamine pyrophosphate-dependent dehydrogenase E1 component subunit alpha [Candidatus Polarisedimenticolia bacterium]